MSRKKNKLVFGVGINDADYAVQPTDPATGKQCVCSYYSKWQSMLKRCYYERYQEKQPTYKGCYVCNEWLTFSVFKEWMEGQDWEGKELDKDLLDGKNKEYSPDKCVFVSNVLNKFVIDSGRARGEHMIGVSFYKLNGKFRSSCQNPITKKNETLGYFTSEMDAHLAWRARKLELVDELLKNGYIDNLTIYSNLKEKYS